MNKLTKAVKYAIAIAIIITIAFLSQQDFLREPGKSLSQQIISEWQKTYNLLLAKVYPNITGNVSRGGEAIKSEAEKQKDNLVKSFWQDFKNYFAKKFSKTFGTEVE